MGLEIVGDMGDQGSGGDNGGQADDVSVDVSTTKFFVYDWGGNQVVFLEMPAMFEGLSEEEMALHIEWNLTRTRNQVGMMFLSQHQIAVPDVVLLDKRLGFLIGHMIPSPLDRAAFELAWEQEMGDLIDGLRDNLNRMILTQGVEGADQLLSSGNMNRQQRRQMERDQLRRNHRGN